MPYAQTKQAYGKSEAKDAMDQVKRELGTTNTVSTLNLDEAMKVAPDELDVALVAVIAMLVILALAELAPALILGSVSTAA